MHDSSALEAFTHTAGFAPAELSLAIRIVFVVSLLIWAVWSIQGEMERGRAGDIQVEDMLQRVLRVLALVATVIALAYIA